MSKKIKVIAKHTERVVVEKEYEIQHRHRLQNWMLWEAEHSVSSCTFEDKVLTRKGFVKSEDFYGWVQRVTCKHCGKTFDADYNHVRGERSRRTKEYLPA